MKFIDEAVILVCSGKGGNGCVSFRREKYVEFGGPDGGDGGKGGSVFIEGHASLNTLVDFKQTRIIQAKPGKNGGPSQCTGAAGEDAVVYVPCGTLVWDADRNSIICDITEPGQRVCLLVGGKPGVGNIHFKSSRNRAPRQRTLGEPSQQMRLLLELKLLADVGLVGLPNAGKSSLIRSLSAARPKVADYPFTTLDPQLGVVKFRNTSYVMADIPGLIEGAAAGVGLGDQFLKHISRCGVLLHLIDATKDIEDIWADYEVIQRELLEHDRLLVDKPQIIVLNKIDCLDDDQVLNIQALFSKRLPKVEIQAISAVAKTNVDNLNASIVKRLELM